jgi:hypothetical protein
LNLNYLKELEKTKQSKNNQHSKPTSTDITKIDSTDIPILTKFSYLKKLLDEKIWTDVDGLAFTEAGYDN